MSGPPLVSVGIPTYNRADDVSRAVDSVRGQVHEKIEVIVSDDGSSDATASVLEAVAHRDVRVRVITQPVNLGHARNFQAVLEAARGEYFMWLSDDDWLDPGYISRCLAVLEQDPSRSLVAGLARYYSAAGEHEIDERPMILRSARPAARVARYLARVNMNGVLFGLGRREQMLGVGFGDQVGGDWLFVAEMAVLGRVITLPDVHIHRSVEGLSSDHRALARSFGMGSLGARQHHFVVATRFAREIALARSYRQIAAPGRGLLALVAWLLIVIRFPGYAVFRTLLARLGLGWVEQTAIDLARRRD